MDTCYRESMTLESILSLSFPPDWGWLIPFFSWMFVKCLLHAMRGMRDSEDIKIVGHGPCSWDVDGQGGRHFWSHCYAKSTDKYVNPRSKSVDQLLREGPGMWKHMFVEAQTGLTAQTCTPCSECKLLNLSKLPFSHLWNGPDSLVCWSLLLLAWEGLLLNIQKFCKPVVKALGSLKSALVEIFTPC